MTCGKTTTEHRMQFSNARNPSSTFRRAMHGIPECLWCPEYVEWMPLPIGAAEGCQRNTLQPQV